MPKEIERQYLVANDVWREHADAGVRITQGYLSVEPERTVRVRMREASPSTLTIKGKNVGAVRPEYEYEIPSEEAEELLELCIPALIDKTRYEVHVGELLWEIDVFYGENEGLVLAEVELDEDSMPYEPEWVGADVTGVAAYYNANLVRRPYRTWDDSP